MLKNGLDYVLKSFLFLSLSPIFVLLSSSLMFSWCVNWGTLWSTTFTREPAKSWEQKNLDHPVQGQSFTQRAAKSVLANHCYIPWPQVQLKSVFIDLSVTLHLSFIVHLIIILFYCINQSRRHTVVSTFLQLCKIQFVIVYLQTGERDLDQG